MCVVLIGRSPWGLFPPGCFLLLLKIPPLPLSYPRCDGDGDRFPQKISCPCGGNSEDITVYFEVGLSHVFTNMYPDNYSGNKQSGITTLYHRCVGVGVILIAILFYAVCVIEDWP